MTLPDLVSRISLLPGLKTSVISQWFKRLKRLRSSVGFHLYCHWSFIPSHSQGFRVWILRGQTFRCISQLQILEKGGRLLCHKGLCYLWHSRQHELRMSPGSLSLATGMRLWEEDLSRDIKPHIYRRHRVLQRLLVNHCSIIALQKQFLVSKQIASGWAIDTLLAF